MTVTPTQLLELSADELILKTKVEAAIDAELQLSFETGQTVVVRHSLIIDLFTNNPRLYDAVIAGYETDWRVVRYENASQGAWLSFSERTV